MVTKDMSLVTVEPLEPHTHTIVFLHGRGDNAHNFAASLAHSRDSSHRSLIAALPSFRWIFPEAPTRKCASSPDEWPQWFDVWNVRDFSENEYLQAVGLKEVVPIIRRLLINEASLLGGRLDRVVLAGISMGAATAAHVLFNFDAGQFVHGRLAAFVGFSCRCPFAGRSLAEMRNVLELEGVPDHNRVIQNTPVLLEHCIDDPLVLVQNGRGMRETLREFGAQVKWKEYTSGGHWFNSPAGIDDAVEFLNSCLLGEVDLVASSTNAMDIS
jgi:predicted esterase